MSDDPRPSSPSDPTPDPTPEPVPVAPPPPPYVQGPPPAAAASAVPVDRWRASVPALVVFAAGMLFGVILVGGVAAVVGDGPDEVRVVRDGGPFEDEGRGPFGR